MKPLPLLHAFVILLGSLATGQVNPVPWISQPLIPESVKPGHKTFTLTVNGTGFSSTAVLDWNGASKPTQVISSGQLQATIDATDLQRRLFYNTEESAIGCSCLRPQLSSGFGQCSGRLQQRRHSRHRSGSVEL
jgi:hypothetical protein